MGIGIIGAGNIGETIYKLLKLKFDDVSIADARPNPALPNCQILDAKNSDELHSFIQNKSIIINAGPYFLNKIIALECAKSKVPYFDLSEDVSATKYAKTLAKESDSFFMPQCGLAPGAINIIAANLANEFDSVRDMQLRVGALPLYPNNRMKYYLSWSTDGLINEYLNEAQAIVDGKLITIPPLAGLEHLILDGIEYEAFSTSGGIGTMTSTWLGKVKNLSYKTMRYPGHRDLMKFLFDDLNLRNNRKVLTEIFNQEVPQTTQDVIVIYVNIVGYLNGKLVQKGYTKKIYGNDEFSAIQLSTASGVCSVINLFLNGNLPQTGFVCQEDVSLDNFVSNSYGSIYQI
jgi:saccharopine dehydrogenase-like NADP-dependent oxidoreductase